MDDPRQQQQRGPRVLLFGADGNPLIVRSPQKKQPIGFRPNDIKVEILSAEVKQPNDIIKCNENENATRSTTTPTDKL